MCSSRSTSMRPPPLLREREVSPSSPFSPSELRGYERIQPLRNDLVMKER